MPTWTDTGTDNTRTLHVFCPFYSQVLSVKPGSLMSEKSKKHWKYSYVWEASLTLLGYFQSLGGRRGVLQLAAGDSGFHSPP